LQLSRIQLPALALDAGLSHRVPPAAWDLQDAAASLWRVATRTMESGDYRSAAEFFDRIHNDFPKSTYTPDSYYWEAFARYRMGGNYNFRQAVTHLDTQQQLFPRTPTASDGIVLSTRLRGELARRGDQQARRELWAILQSADECSPIGVNVKIAALDAVRQIDEPMTVRLIRDMFLRPSSCGGYLRQQSVFLLAQAESPEADEILLELARGSKELDVRIEAVQWMAEVADERAITLLEEIVLSPSPFRLKETAFFSLTQIATAADVAVFRDISSSRHAQVEIRTKAIHWLAEQRLQDQSDWILGLYRSDRNPAIREAVVSAVASQGNLADRGWLMSVSRDTTATLAIRRQAIAAVAEMHAPPSELYSLYHQVSPIPLREQIIDILGRNREKVAIDRLIDIALLDADSTMRTSSLKWLRQSKDPRAVEFLIAYREKLPW
jgi:HEAT repeat protein